MKKHQPLLLTALLWALLAFTSQAQQPTPVADTIDLTLARQLTAEATALCDAGKWAEAELRAERAYNFLHSTPNQNQNDLAEAAYQTGRAAYEQDKFNGSRPFFQEAAQIWRTIYPEGSLRTADALHLLSVCLRVRDKVDDALIACTEAYQIRQKLLPVNHTDMAASLRGLGKTYLSLGQYAKANDYFAEALAIEKIVSGENSAKVADLLENIGEAQLRLSQYESSIASWEKALLIRQHFQPPVPSDIAYDYYGLGSTYKALRKYDISLDYFEKALDIRIKIAGENNINVAALYSEIGQFCMVKRDFTKAKFYFEKENDIMVLNDATNDVSYAYTCNDLGRLYGALKNFPEAIIWQEKMLALWSAGYKNSNSTLASIHTNIGSSRISMGEFELALQHYGEAKKIWTSIYGPEHPMSYKADVGLAVVYRKWYIKTGQDSLLQKSRQHFRLAEIGLEMQLQKEVSPQAQRKFLAEAMPIMEKAINTELLVLKKQQQPQALEKAWQLSESMHSYMLLAAAQESNARHFAGIPDELLSRDSLLRIEITQLEKKRQSLVEQQGLPLTDSLVLAQNAKIFNKKEAAIGLRAFFEKNYPDYFRLKFDLKTASIAQAQELLTPQQTLLEYFTGDSSIFVFVLHRNDAKAIELPRDFPLSEWVQGLREGITGYHAAKIKKPGLYENTVRQYADYAEKLHLKLLAPLAAFLTPELIIIPGDELTNIPFEALLTAPPKDLSSFNTYPFVLRSHTIQYAYSATMLLQMTTRNRAHATSGDLLAFAPFFDGDTAQLSSRLAQEDAVRLGLSPLPFSGEEVTRAINRVGGPSQVLIGNLATKQQFLAMAGQYQILHLATHGKADHSAGDFSFLAFSTDKGASENGLLSVGELYNCSLQADLVVLSACETGIGEEQRGEGVVSLARAFAFAGAKSIVASLWSVNDKSTMQVMDAFYAALVEGKTKNMALSQAKWQYLEEHPGAASHPFFWAGFVAVGDMGKIKN